jgi:hypothetical protein
MRYRVLYWEDESGTKRRCGPRGGFEVMVQTPQGNCSINTESLHSVVNEAKTVCSTGAEFGFETKDDHQVF